MVTLKSIIPLYFTLFLIAVTQQSLAMNREIPITTTTSTSTPSNSSKIYKQSCKKINTQQHKKLDCFMQQFTKKNRDKQHSKIESKLKNVTKQIDTLENELSHNLQQEFQIPEDKWILLLKIVQEIKNSLQEDNFVPKTKAIHDKSIPKYFKCIIKTCLVNKHINPHNVDIFFLIQHKNFLTEIVCHTCTLKINVCLLILIKDYYLQDK